MKRLPIAAAERLAREVGAERIAIVALDGERFSITTWAARVRDCRALAAWAESEAAVEMAVKIAEARG